MTYGAFGHGMGLIIFSEDELLSVDKQFSFPTIDKMESDKRCLTGTRVPNHQLPGRLAGRLLGRRRPRHLLPHLPLQLRCLDKVGSENILV